MMRRRLPTALLAAGLTATACSSPTRAGLVAVNGTSLYVEERGSGPPVILLQGAQLDLTQWDDQFAVLARRFRVIRYDARGFGRSQAKRGPYAAHDDLRALMDHLGIARASLIGLSLGGRVAIDFALAHPQMVERLVLVGPGLSGFRWPPENEPWVDSLLAALRNRDSVRVAQVWLESGYMRPAMRDSALAGRLRTLAVRNASLWVQPDSERTPDPPAIRRLSSITAPTLLVIGGLDVPGIMQIADTLAASLPSIRRADLPDAGHVPNMEQPEAFNRLVVDFLRGPTPAGPATP